MNEIELQKVDFASTGAIGEPGKRVFVIQGVQDLEQVSVIVEKHQVETLSNQAIDFLDSLIDDFPDEKIASPIDFDNAGLIKDIEPSFRARAIGLMFDPDTGLVTLELCELSDDLDDSIYFAQDAESQANVVRMTMTRTQLRAMAVRGHEAVVGGREPCLLCQEPMDLSGHVCPRLN